MQLKTFNEYLKDLGNKTIKLSLLFIGLILLFTAISKSFIAYLINYYGLAALTFSPMESINIQIRFGLICSILIMIPILTMAIYNYVKNDLPFIKRYLKYIFLSEALGIFGFIIGITIFAKYMLNIMQGYAIGDILWGIDNILQTSFTMALGIALSLQLMLIIPILYNLNIIKSNTFSLKTRYMIFIALLLIAGWITPPDPVSLFVLIIPTYGSFELGVFITKIKEKLGGKKWQSEQWKESSSAQ